MTSTPPKHIVILPGPDDDVVAHYIELGETLGDFSQSSGGQIHFSYRGQDARRWYVNRDIAAFRESAAIFNRCCELHADDEDSDDDVAWSSVATQLQRDLECVEPFPDPEISLWSATVHDTEGGLLSLC